MHSLSPAGDGWLLAKVQCVAVVLSAQASSLLGAGRKKRRPQGRRLRMWPKVSADVQPLQVACLSPFLEDLEELDSATAVLTRDEPILIGFAAFVVVVPRCALGEHALGFIAVAVTGRAPLILRFLGRFDDLCASFACFADDICHLAGLLVEHVCRVGCDASLGETQNEAIGEIVSGEAVVSAQSIGPLFAQAGAVFANQIIAGLAGVAGADLEAGGEDQAIHLVFHPLDYDAFFGDFVDALTLGIDQRYAGPIVGLQVFIVEAGALAELAIIGF